MFYDMQDNGSAILSVSDKGGYAVVIALAPVFYFDCI